MVFNKNPYSKATVLWSKQNERKSELKKNWITRSKWMKNVVTAYGGPCVKLVVL